ncbi:DUF6085 family protein [Streptomyces xanthochromogenes]|uniref:DUF6085 family protein n=1 Tax=Streptomyces xanthochromogenes TaxID=67384 RepID=UPI003818754C
MPDQPDPLAPFRAIADQYAAQAADAARNAEASTGDAPFAQQGIAAGWQHAEFLLRHTIDDLDNSRTTGNNPPTSAFPDVQGHCPACRGRFLFLSSGGYITCSRADCPDPDAVSTLLQRRADITPAEEGAADRRYWTGRYDREGS